MILVDEDLVFVCFLCFCDHYTVFGKQYDLFLYIDRLSPKQATTGHQKTLLQESLQRLEHIRRRRYLIAASRWLVDLTKHPKMISIQAFSCRSALGTNYLRSCKKRRSYYIRSAI